MGQPMLDVERLKELLTAIRRYSVLVMGDGIMDEYCYVTPLSKNPKENIICTLYDRKETFRGGTWAAARHVEGFCRNVRVITGKNTVTKRRFIEENYLRKLFEVHEISNSGIAEEVVIQDYDVVIVTDFGHGFVTPELIARLTEKAKYLAVNAQTNSANFGFNLITKYPRADFVVIDEPEARLAAQDRDSPLEEVILKLGFPKIIVTHGSKGAVGYDGTFVSQPAITRQVVDTMGAGDAFFSITAPFAKAGASMEELVHIGNLAGSVKCGIVGHRRPVDQEALIYANG